MNWMVVGMRGDGYLRPYMFANGQRYDNLHLKNGAFCLRPRLISQMILNGKSSATAALNSSDAVGEGVWDDPFEDCAHTYCTSPVRFGHSIAIVRPKSRVRTDANPPHLLGQGSLVPAQPSPNC